MGMGILLHDPPFTTPRVFQKCTSVVYTLVCDHSNKSFLKTVFLCATVYYSVEGVLNFHVCG